METETHLIVSQKLGYVSQEDLQLMQARIEEIGKMLNGLIQSLRGHRRAEPGSVG